MTRLDIAHKKYVSSYYVGCKKMEKLDDDLQKTRGKRRVLGKVEFRERLMRDLGL